MRLAAPMAGMVAAVLVAAAPAAARPAPRVDQLVAFSSGAATVERVQARATRVTVDGRRCAVAVGTPLAALARTAAGRLRLRDFGSCSRRPGDGGGLFVLAIGPERNAGFSGWTYKVGNRLATAGAADPSGPFGAGRLRTRERVTWFYCRPQATGGSCQRSLSTRTRAGSAGVIVVTVRAHDDEGRAEAAKGATVRVGSQEVSTDARGVARVKVDPGTYAVHAEQAGRTRSFPERVVVG